MENEFLVEIEVYKAIFDYLTIVYTCVMKDFLGRKFNLKNKGLFIR